MKPKRMSDEFKPAAPAPALVTVNKYCKIRGCDSKTVKSAIESGRLRKSVVFREGSTPLIDPELADQEWPRPVTAFQPSGGDRRVTADWSEIPALTESKAKQAAADAELAELKRDQMKGTLVNADEVKQAAFKLARTVRDSMINIPDRVSEEFAAETDGFKIHKRLTEEIRKALESLASDTPS